MTKDMRRGPPRADGRMVLREEDWRNREVSKDVPILIGNLLPIIVQKSLQKSVERENTILKQ